MRTVSYDNTFGMVDLAVYTELIADDNKDQINRLKRNLTRALRQDITAKQRQYMMLYYGQNMSMEAIAKLEPRQQRLIRQVYFEGRTFTSIAQEKGVDRTAVSKATKRAIRKLKKFL